ncbi:MAG: hypothetical protein EXS64_14710 [Candidatus Latescibacteria bacterium]|nr:hypothetical protein [Candidatus Latescibacterota bacterium]
MPDTETRKSPRDPDAEIHEYRDLMTTPTTFEEGFTLRTILGVLFISVVMVPGNMYLSLMTGGSLGAAAEWVTIILFIEIARRSFTTLKRQEIYVLFYVAASLVAAETGTFQGLLWNQYLVQSEAARQFGIAHLIPRWVAPPLGSEALTQRTFLHGDWLMPIGLLLAGLVIGRVSWFTMGYTLFRLTSDVERLAFPFAPINAQGALALAESSAGEETWRWRVFSTGAMIGAGFGALYVGVPAITGALLTEPVQIFPIPFADITRDSGYVLPATPLGLSFHLGTVIVGLVAPFWGVVGAVAGSLTYVAACPILHHYGYLPRWQLGMGSLETFFINGVDFWMSFGIGVTFAVALVGFYQVFTGMRRRRAEQRQAEGERSQKSRLMSVVRRESLPPGRGDFSVPVMLGLFAAVTLGTIGIARWMIPEFPFFYFLFFGFIFTPIMSFVNARLIGMVGQSVSIPFVKQGAIFLSGYRGVDVWFVPFPLENYGATAQKFREIELTGTKFTSILKAEVFMVPIVLVTSFLYWSYLWRLAPIPSSTYPYAQVMWRLQAYQESLWLSATLRGETKVEGSKATWQPANLPDRTQWYWRASAVDKDGNRGRWSQVGTFETRSPESRVTGSKSDSGPATRDPSTPLRTSPQPGSEEAKRLEGFDLGRAGPTGQTDVLSSLPTPELISPAHGEVMDTLAPTLTAHIPQGVHGVFFEVDTDPAFLSRERQTSEDKPLLLQALKPGVIGAGMAAGLGLFLLSGVFGLPTLLAFGYVRSLTTMPHFILPEIVGALLARFYFWKKYGRQQWRMYALILSVGFSSGMALMAMISIGVALIQKSVSPLVF